MIWLMFEIHFLSYSIMFIYSLFTHNVSFQFLVVYHFNLMAFPPTIFKAPRRKSPKQTDKQTNKETGINKPRSRDPNGFAYHCFRVARRVHKGTNKQHEITATLRFPQRANDKTTCTNQAMKQKLQETFLCALKMKNK